MADKVQIDDDPDGLFNAVNNALDILAMQAKESDTTTSDWISVSIPKLRVNASPMINGALDAIENNPQTKEVFRCFVKDAITNPAFRESLKKSLRDPQITTIVKTLVGQNNINKAM